MSEVHVYGIRDTAGHWYTGDRWGGDPVFHPDPENAIELDEEEAEHELKGMPHGCEKALLHTFAARRPTP